MDKPVQTRHTFPDSLDGIRGGRWVPGNGSRAVGSVGPVRRARSGPSIRTREVFGSGERGRAALAARSGRSRPGPSDGSRSELLVRRHVHERRDVVDLTSGSGSPCRRPSSSCTSAAAAFVMTVAPPFVIALMIMASVSAARPCRGSGPMLPTAPAAFSVWHAAHVLDERALPAFALPTSFGVAPRVAERRRTISAAASARPAIPRPMPARPCSEALKPPLVTVPVRRSTIRGFSAHEQCGFPKGADCPTDGNTNAVRAATEPATHVSLRAPLRALMNQRKPVPARYTSAGSLDGIGAGGGSPDLNSRDETSGRWWTDDGVWCPLHDGFRVSSPSR